jgi:Raf kinase inhibitor-like YbhB/YbcL family protein
MPNRYRIAIAAVILYAALFAIPAHAQLTLTSSALTPGAAIAPDYSCVGADRSPALAWSNLPPATKSFALIVDDTDAPGGTFIHWVVFNIPARVTSLPQGVPPTVEISGGGENGINSFDRVGYNGPCPPPGGMHHYHFRLFALDVPMIEVVDKAHADAIQSAMQGHVIATAELVGTFQR